MPSARNLILIGYRGTGKTTVARMLADDLGWAAVDADDEIESRAGKSIKAIFAEDGEPVFRNWETQVVLELCQGSQQVLAMGGGAILREQNRTAMRSSGTVVWLTADAETLFDRITTDPITQERRPNLTAAGGIDEITQLLAARTDNYQAAAHLEIDTTGRSPRQVADAVRAAVDA